MADASKTGSNEPHSHSPSFTKYLGGAWGASVVLIALIALLDNQERCCSSLWCSQLMR